jgi:ferrous iron transport protein B
VLEARQLGLPLIVVLNKMDRARQLGITINKALLARELNLPVVETVSLHAHGADELKKALDETLREVPPAHWKQPGVEQVLATQRAVLGIFERAVTAPAIDKDPSIRIDRFLMHPLWGFVVLGLVLFATFLAVFSGGDVLSGWIEDGFGALAGMVEANMAEGSLRGLVVEGVIGGVGGVIVFLPQILILFLFILALEASGYLPRAAFLLDKPMSAAGLSGRSFIPLLSSFACAIPGIMATRTISHWRDRLTTILIAPLMACSARIPVYTLIVAAMFPDDATSAALVMVGLYVLGIVAAMTVAWVIKRSDNNAARSPLLMELPAMARCPQSGHRPVGTRHDLPAPRGHHHPGAHHCDVGAVHHPFAAHQCRGGAAQPGRRARARVALRVQTHWLQRADLLRAGARHGRARGGGERTGHCLCHGRGGGGCG